MAFDWNQLGQGMLSTGMNLWKAGEGVDLAKQNLEAAGSADAQRRAAYGTYAGQLQGLAPSIQAGYQMKPATATTGFATSQIDPNTGKVGYQMTPEAQGLFTRALGGATSALGQAEGFDPEAMAAKRFAAQQKLLAPQRATEDAKRMADLQRRGLVGLGSRTGAAEGGPNVNPYEAAAQAARAQADARAAYESLNEGESYLDRLIGRSKGLAGYAGDIDARGQKALDVAGDWTNRFSQNERAKTDALTGLFSRAFQAQREGAYDQTAMDKILAAKAGLGQARLGRTSGIADTGAGMLSGILGSGGLNLFSKAGSALSGLFGGGNSFYDGGASYSYDVPSLDFGSSWDDGSIYTSVDMFPSGYEF